MRNNVDGREGTIYTQGHARRSNRLRASGFAGRRRLFFQGPVMPTADLRNSRLDDFIASFVIRLRGRGTSAALTLLLLSSVLLSACGTPEPAQRDRFYSLAPSSRSPPTRHLRHSGQPCLVNDLGRAGVSSAAGRSSSARSDHPLEVQRYNLLLWEEPPGSVRRRPDLAPALRAAQLFEFVITPAQRSRADYILGGEIDRFEHLPTAAPPKVRGRLQPDPDARRRPPLPVLTPLPGPGGNRRRQCLRPWPRPSTGLPAA